MYDVIGDIHGHAEELEALFSALGYRRSRSGWRVPAGRLTVFVGDYIDRGPRIRRTVELVQALVARGEAVALAGNHEYNALCRYTLGSDGRPLRPETPENRAQHERTRVEYGGRPGELAGLLRWIRSLPLFWEAPGVRAVHAVWDAASVALVRAVPGGPSALAHARFVERSAVRGTAEHRAVERLLKGVEVELPPGHSYRDKEGAERRSTRVKWWLTPSEIAATSGSSSQGDTDLVPLSAVAMPPADRRLADARIPVDRLGDVPGYCDPEACFVGHYWLTGDPAPLAPRVACVDYSVARAGALCAYRFDGALPLTGERFVCVSAGSDAGDGGRFAARF